MVFPIDNKMNRLLLLLMFQRCLGFRDDDDKALFDLIRHSSSSDTTTTNPAVRSFAGRRVASSHEHRQLRTEYINACHNPDLLYVGTEASGRCTCDESHPRADRILCIVEGISCNQALCTEEHDIWVFDKETGDMVSRSTCVVCAEEATSCDSFDDTCFHAMFDEQQEMLECLLLQNTDPVASCSNCLPCYEDGWWGMEFDCFDGRWNSNGACITGSRVGHVPEFPVPGDPDFVEEIPVKSDPSENIETGKPSHPPATGTVTNKPPLPDAEKKMDIRYPVSYIIIAAVLLGIGFGVFFALICNNGKIVQKMEESDDKDFYDDDFADNEKEARRIKWFQWRQKQSKEKTALCSVDL